MKTPDPHTVAIAIAGGIVAIPTFGLAWNLAIECCDDWRIGLAMLLGLAGYGASAILQATWRQWQKHGEPELPSLPRGIILKPERRRAKRMPWWAGEVRP